MSKKTMKNVKISMFLVLGVGIVLGIMIAQTTLETVFAKPNKVDGKNYPEGRCPQQIINGKYPRSYFPNTEKIGEEHKIVRILFLSQCIDLKLSGEHQNAVCKSVDVFSVYCTGVGYLKPEILSHNDV